MSNLIYGIDFGTTNSVIEVYDADRGEVISSGKFDKSIESAIFFPEGDRERYFLGKQAIHQYVASGMKGRLIKSIKSALPEPSLGTISIFGKKVKVEVIVSYFLQYLKETCDAHLNVDVDRVVLGRPSVFSPEPEKDALAEKRLVTAAKMAGFNEIRVLREPIAAALDYERQISTPKKVLVGDLGGGTSDFCIMNLDPDSIYTADRGKDIIATSGIKIGGDDFDAEIMWHRLVDYFGYGAEYESFGKWLSVPVYIFKTICSWEKLSLLRRVDMQQSLKKFHFYSNEKEKLKRLLTLVEKNLGFAVVKAVEKAKITLGANTEALITYQQHDIDIDVLLLREELGEMLNKHITALRKTITALLADAQLDADDIDVVFLTGGSSLVEPVGNLFVELFGEEKVQSGNAFKSIAYGLASSAGYLFSDQAASYTLDSYLFSDQAASYTLDS